MTRLLIVLFWAAVFAGLMSCVTTGTDDWQKHHEPLKPGALRAEKTP
jgi:hypothetical protein